MNSDSHKSLALVTFSHEHDKHGKNMAYTGRKTYPGNLRGLTKVESAELTARINNPLREGVGFLAGKLPGRRLTVRLWFVNLTMRSQT